MPVRKIRAKRSTPGRQDALMRQVTQTTCDLLAEGARVLVVYDKAAACIYYEGEDAPPAREALPQAS